MKDRTGTKVPDAQPTTEVVLRTFLPNDPENPIAPKLSRQWIGKHLADLAGSDVLDDVTLLVDELVSNSVLHGSGEILIVLRRTSALIRVEVMDGGSNSQPQIREHDDAGIEENGRGLQLVEMLAARWGYEARADNRTAVWFEIGS